MTILLLLSGDVETNPGPATVAKSTYWGQHELRVGLINAWAVVNKTELVFNVIDEQKLDVLAITETFLKWTTHLQ